MFSNTNIP